MASGERSSPVRVSAPARLPMPLLGSLVAAVVLLGAGWYVYGGAFFEAIHAPSNLSIAGLATTSRLAAPGATVTLTETELLSKVSKLMELPKDQATIEVVSNLAPLKKQAFFRNARVGDIVLMYKKSLRAILYDPEKNKIVEVAPITFNDK